MADFTGVSLNRGLSPNFFNNALQSLSYISNIQRIRLSVNHAQNDLPNIMSKARNFQSGFWYWDGVPWFGHRVLWSRWRWHGSMPPLSLLEAARDGHVVDYLRGTVGPDLWYVLSVLFLTPAFCFIWPSYFFATNSYKYHCILSFCWLFQVPFLGQNRGWSYIIQRSMI